MNATDGHVPLTVSASEASSAGQRSIEHFTGFLLESSTHQAIISQRVDEYLRAEGGTDKAIARVVFHAPPPELLSTFDPARAARIVATFRRNSTWQDPTLTMLRTIAHPEAVARNPYKRHVPRGLQSQWQESFLLPRDLTPAERAMGRRFYAKYAEVFRMMIRADVGLLAGTDVGFPYIVPGFSLHDELEEMVRLGMTPRQALRHYECLGYGISSRGLFPHDSQAIVLSAT